MGSFSFGLFKFNDRKVCIPQKINRETGLSASGVVIRPVVGPRNVRVKKSLRGSPNERREKDELEKDVFMIARDWRVQMSWIESWFVCLELPPKEWARSPQA